MSKVQILAEIYSLLHLADGSKSPDDPTVPPQPGLRGQCEAGGEADVPAHEAARHFLAAAGRGRSAGEAAALRHRGQPPELGGPAGHVPHLGPGREDGRHCQTVTSVLRFIW